MDTAKIADRAAGAIMGALVGDALGLGPHWFYDLTAMRKHYGNWITDYTDPLPKRYHGGMKAGQVSQTGLIMGHLLDSLVACNGYEEADFAQRLDKHILSEIDGTPFAGPGGYTNQSIRELYRARVVEGRSWHDVGDYADTSEAAERGVILAAAFADDLTKAVTSVRSNCRLTQIDPFVVSQTMAFAAIIGMVIQGEPFDPGLGMRMRELGKDGVLPFTYATLSEELGAGGPTPPPPSADAPYPDGLLAVSWCIEAATSPDIRIEPAWRVSTVYGMACAINLLLPAAYYLVARFPGEFEAPVLHALNGGGQNMSRACLTGALAGASVGLSGIPERFLTGLDHGVGFVEKAKMLGQRLAARVS